MKSRILIALIVCVTATSVRAQEHYALMRLVTDNFFQTRNSKFEKIEITWNMEGIIQADLNDGINFLFEDKPLRAVGRFDIVLGKDPSLWQAYYYRGVAYRQLKEHNKAVADFKSAIRLNQNLYEAYVETAKVYLALGSLRECETSIKRAIRTDEKRPAAYYLKGCLEQAQNKTDLATTSFRECLSADMSYHRAQIDLALIELTANHNEANALKELDLVLHHDSLQADALMMRAILTFDKNKNQSVADLTRVIRINPASMIAPYLRGALLTNLGQYDRAFADFQTVIKGTATDDNNFKGQQSWVDKKIDVQNVGAYTLTRVYGLPDDDTEKLKKAFCMIITGDYSKSIHVLNSTSNQTREPLTVYLKAVAHEHMGKHYPALNLYNQAIYLDNTIADAYKKRGIYSMELKEWTSSIDDFNTVLRLRPQSFNIYKIRGISHHFNQNYERAINDFTEYIKHDTTDQEAVTYRGLSYMKNEQPLHAYIDFANSNYTAGINNKAMLRQADSVLTIGDTTLALKALETFVKRMPAFTEAYALKLRVHASKNEWAIVQRELETALENLSSKSPRRDQAYLFTLKGMAIRDTAPTDAIDAFDRAIRSDKASALAYLERGKILLAQNKTLKAVDDFKKAALLGNAEAKTLLDGLVKQVGPQYGADKLD
jgi:tetratricopeptide (TPR) repeat protein